MKGIILNGLLVLGMLVMGATPILAQGGGQGMNHGDKRAQFIEELGLSAEQQEQFDALRASHQAAMKTWREQNPDASKEDRMAFRDELHTSGRAAMESFLSPEQLAKVDEHHARGMGGNGHHGRRAMRKQLAEQLDLSDEQKEKLAELRKEQCVAMRDGLKSILTAAQFEELEELREARKNRRGGAGGRMGDCWK